MDPVLHLSIVVDDLPAARRFYVDTLGCRPGREYEEWLDVWFFGLQLTLQSRPDEVASVGEQGARHFGVALDADTFASMIARLRGTR